MNVSAMYFMYDVATNPPVRKRFPSTKNARVSAVSQNPPPRKHAFATNELLPSGQEAPPTPRVTRFRLMACASVVT